MPNKAKKISQYVAYLVSPESSEISSVKNLGYASYRVRKVSGIIKGAFWYIAAVTLSIGISTLH